MMRRALILYGGLGDVALISALSRLLAQSGHAHLILVTSEKFVAFARRYGAFDSVIAHSLEGGSRALRELACLNVAGVYDLHNTSFTESPYFAWLSNWRGAAIHLPFIRAARLDSRVPVTIVPERITKDNDANVVSYLRRLGITDVLIQPNSLRLLPRRGDFRAARLWRERLGTRHNGEIVALVPFSRYQHKQWLQEHWKAFVRAIKATNRALCLVCSRPEFDQAKALDLGEDVNIVAADTPEEYVAIALAVDIVVTVDSGIKHIAGYLNRPVLALYGPTSPRIWGTLSKLEFQALGSSHCHPCNNSYFCPAREWICMQLIRPEQVAQALDHQLGRTARPMQNSLI